MDLAALEVASLGVWAFFLAGIILMLLELVVPGVFLIWLGLAAVATGLVDLAVTLSWQRELLLFAVLAIAFAVIGRNLMRREAGRASDRPFLNRRAAALVGRTFVLAEPITAGAGRVHVDDSVWRVVGPDLPAGAKVRVSAVEGSALVVEPAPDAAS